MEDVCIANGNIKRGKEMNKEKIIISETFRNNFDYLRVYLSQLDEDLEEFADGTDCITREDIVEDATFCMPDFVKSKFKEDFPEIIKLLNWFIKQTETKKYQDLYSFFDYILKVMAEFEKIFKDFDGSNDSAWKIVNQYQLYYESIIDIKKKCEGLK